MRVTERRSRVVIAGSIWQIRRVRTGDTGYILYRMRDHKVLCRGTIADCIRVLFLQPSSEMVQLQLPLKEVCVLHRKVRVHGKK